MSLSDLSDQPLSDRPLLRPEVQEYLDYVTGLCETDEVYAYAADTLSGIAQTIRDTGRVTPGQRTAVANIVSGAHRHDDRPRWGRRYEGRR